MSTTTEMGVCNVTEVVYVMFIGAKSLTTSCRTNAKEQGDNREPKEIARLHECVYRLVTE